MGTGGGTMHSEVESLSTQECWYLAYGSNLLPEKLARYVDDVSRPKVALSIKRRLYFAGKSSKWKGGVAFISVVDDNSASTHVLAYKVAGEELAGIFRGENGIGYGFPKDPSLLDIGVGEYRQILTMASDDKTRGKI